MKKLTELVSAEEFFELSRDGVRRDLVRGEVREMTLAGARHGWTTGSLHVLLGSYVRKQKLGWVFAAETGCVIERGPDTVRAPDLAFVRLSRIPGEMPEKFLPFAPDLVVETISPDDRLDDVMDKVTLWLNAGAALAWVVDPAARTVSVHFPAREPRLLHESDSLDGEDVVPGFRITVGEIWA